MTTVVIKNKNNIFKTFFRLLIIARRTLKFLRKQSPL
jgi:hypothetical protein